MTAPLFTNTKDGEIGDVGNDFLSAAETLAREKVYPIAPFGEVDLHRISRVPHGTDKDVLPEHILHRILIFAAIFVRLKRRHKWPCDGKPRIEALPRRRVEIGKKPVAQL